MNAFYHQIRVTAPNKQYITMHLQHYCGRACIVSAVEEFNQFLHGLRLHPAVAHVSYEKAHIDKDPHIQYTYIGNTNAIREQLAILARGYDGAD